MDPALPCLSESRTHYPDPDGMLVCQFCYESAHYCLCTVANLSRRSTFLPSTFLDHPEWPSGPTFFPGPSPELEPPMFESPSQPLAVSLQQLEEDATKIQDSTISVWNEGTYHVGDRTSPGNETEEPRRQAARKNGFPCLSPGCEKVFDRKCDLKRHMKLHLGSSERPHKCNVCQEGFIYPKDLSRHQRKHSPSRPQLYCHIEGCSRADGFSRRDNLLRHIRKQHPGEVAL